MGLRIQNNISAMNAHKNLQIADSGMSKSLERLSSGYRINSAKDDAAGLSISQGFRADIASYKVASRNTAEANSLLQVAEGSIDQIGNMLTRLKELATQAASANSGSNLDKINAEGNKLVNEIDRIANSTEYAGTKLLDGSFGVSVSGGTFNAAAGLGGAEGLVSASTYNIVAASTSATEASITVSATFASGEHVSQTVFGVTEAASGTTKDVSFEALGLKLTLNDNWTDATATTTLTSSTATASNFQVGAKNTGNDQVGVLLGSATSTALGLSTDQLSTAANAKTFMATLDTAIGTLSSTRGDIGAAQNRLSYAAANLSTTIENTQAAESVIRDVDMAAEMTTFTKNQILLQAGTAMLAQANMAPQGVLSLFG
ncbi:MAG: flagellin [Pseudomonadota bacterium]